MRKKFLFLYCLVFAFSVAAAPARLVLLGEKNACDQLTAELSADDGIELLERAEVEKVLREHTFHIYSSMSLKKHFPHADVFAVLADKRLVVFNAKNGFRLYDGTAENGAGNIRAAVGKLAAKDPLYLSLVSVRDVGVPRELKPRIEEVITLLEQNLMRRPEIQMLERARLDRVVDERELTDKQYALTPSARLLVLEFEPVAGASAVKAKLIVNDLRNRKIGAIEHGDCFKAPEDAVDSLIKGIFALLAERPDGSADTRKEAHQYFSEYQRLVKSQGSGQQGEIEKFRAAKDKLFAALALAPMDENIRHAELVFYGKMMQSYSIYTDERYREARRQLERSRKFHADFPRSTKAAFDHFLIFGSWNCDFSRLEPALWENYAALARELRSAHIDESRRLWHPYDLTDGINSLKELGNFTTVVIRSNWGFNYFCDQRGWLKQRFEDYRLLYREAAEYVKKNPGDADRANRLISECYLDDLFYGNHALDIPLLTEYLESTAEWCKWVEQSPLDGIKIKAFVLDAMREAIAERTEENFTRAIDRLIERVAAFSPRLVMPPEKPGEKDLLEHIWHLRTFCRELMRRDDLPVRRLKAYREKSGLKSELMEMKELMAAVCRPNRVPAWVETARCADLMRKYNLQRLKNINHFGYAFKPVVDSLLIPDGNGKAVPENKMRFFYELNSAFEIETRPYRDIAGAAPRLRAAAEQDGEVVLFFDKQRVVIRGKSGNWEPLPDAPAVLAPPAFRLWKHPMALSGSHFVYGGGDKSLNIYDRREKTWRTVKDFFPEDARSLLIYGNSIYALVGEGEWAVNNIPNYMLSCNLEGAERKILFSTERSEKLVEPDRLRGGLSGLTVRKPGKLAFLLTYTNNYTHVWEYDVAENTFAQLFKAPGSGTDADSFWRGRDGSLYLCTHSWSERIYRIATDGAVEWIFAQGGGKRKNDPPEAKPVFLTGQSQLHGPWQVRGHELWSGGSWSALLDLNRIDENPPLLLLPNTHYVYELTDGRMLFLGSYRYFIVKKREGAQ